MRNLTATLCLTIAVLLGSAGVSESADFQKGLTAYESGDYATALREWKLLAKQGNAVAQFNLGVMYYNGQGVPQDDKTAVKWYRLAAEQGYADAQGNLGQMYRKGEGVPQDYKTAVKWYRLAAEQGDADAQKAVERLEKKIAEQKTSPTVTAEKTPKPQVDQQKLLILARRTQEALQVLGLYSGNLDGIIGVKTRSAIQRWQKRYGYPDTGEVTEAQFARLKQEAIARLAEEKSEPKVAKSKPSLTVTAKKSPAPFSGDFQKGLDAYDKRDYATALRELKPFAEQGNASAQSNLGAMYEKGQGVPQDDKTAVKWYRLAAEQGDADAQGNLGLMYDNGRGVPQDDKTAVKWYRLAAEQGNASAQFYLGQMYDIGEGVPQDDKTAVKWYRLAAEQGFALAQANLGVMYEYGQGVQRDYKTALKLYRLAAEQGDADAQGNLGVMYAFGTGVLKDYVYAHMWGNIAATNGNEMGAELRDDFEKKMTPAQIADAQKLARECVRKKYKGC